MMSQVTFLIGLEEAQDRNHLCVQQNDDCLWTYQWLSKECNLATASLPIAPITTSFMFLLVENMKLVVIDAFRILTELSIWQNLKHALEHMEFLIIT